MPSPNYIAALALVLGKCLALGSHIFIYQVFCNHYFIFMFLSNCCLEHGFVLFVVADICGMHENTGNE